MCFRPHEAAKRRRTWESQGLKGCYESALGTSSALLWEVNYTRDDLFHPTVITVAIAMTIQQIVKAKDARTGVWSRWDDPLTCGVARMLWVLRRLT